ncbi:MAG: hypothetical protein K2W96_11275 [Gemmataceae bacterium]|nr:hypothetical protein [Gemmataceae bacterium]
MILLLLAAPFVERLDPPVLRRGKTALLAPVGSGLGSAVGLWTTLGDKIEAKPAKGGLSVRVASDAPLGVFGVRVATPDGLSNLHLCLIDDLPVRAASEGVSVSLPCALWGRFREGEADTFSIEAKAGQSLSIEAVGSRLGKEVDPLVTIRDARGKIVAQHDNDPGLMFDCRFGHVFKEAGRHTVEMRDARYQGHPHGSWVLRLGTFPAARVAVPLAVAPGKRAKLFLPEIGGTVEAGAPDAVGPLSLTVGGSWLSVEASDLPNVTDGTPTRLPANLCGILGKDGKAAPFKLLLEKGQALHAVGHARRHDSAAELELVLLDDKGRELRRAQANDDVEPRLDFAAPAAGTYSLEVRDTTREGGPAHAFRIEARSEPPPPVVMAEIEGLTVPRGDWQPVPLAVARNGFAGDIVLSLEGAPEGVSLSPSAIPAGKDAVACKLSASSKAALGLRNLRLRASAGKRSFLVRSRPLIDRQLLNVDLIPYSLREDQRRLPPTVSGEIALMVTEASPFSFDLKQEAVVLARYQGAPIPLVTTRAKGFDAPIRFVARGGQLADKEEGRTRVYAEFPEARKEGALAGEARSRILANLGKSRIEVTGTAKHGSRSVSLSRTFELEIRTAFAVRADKGPLKLAPGAAGKATIRVDRAKSFAGPVTVELSPQDGLECPEKATIPAGKDAVEVEVRVKADAGAGRRGIGLHGTALVDGFEEEARGDRVEVEVAKGKRP